MRPEFSGQKARESAFTQALAALKSNGSNIIVVGDDAGAHAAACERLLGGDGPRRRIVVRTGADEHCGWLPEAGDEGTLEVVSHGEAAATPDATVVDDDLVGPLGQAVVETIDGMAASEGGVEPAELRVCVDALGPLFAGHEPETVFKLVHVLTARTREVRGMGHFHVRVPEADDHVRLLEPLFDAVVTVRSADGAHEHRWRLPDQDIESDWIEL